MAVRLKEWLIPYTWGIGIEITNNHIINVLLREANNLIHVNGNRELYVDLQLDDVILPDDDFPVGVTTGKILEENGWEQSWLILNWKTTSGDYARIIYAVDDNIYMDCWDGVWRLLWISEEVLAQINTQTFYITDEHDLTNWQKAYDWYNEGKDALIGYNDAVYTLVGTSSDTWVLTLEFRDTKAVIEDWQSTSTSKQEFIKLNVLESTNTISSISIWEIQISPNVLATWVNYNTPYTPEYLWSPTTKKYVDDWLATKQPLLTAWTRITIDQNNVISADVTWLFIYKWNVATINDLPANPTVWDTYLVEATGLLYAWDWTQWNPLWSTAIDLSNYFNKTTDTTDDITEWSLNLFCTSTEKNYWNLKQDRLTAWAGITINQNNVISTTPYNTGEWIDITGQTITNTLPFKPDNTGTALQVLKRIWNGYQWLDENNTTYTAGTGINIDANNVISNTWVTSVNWDTGTVTVKEFEPWNTWVNGQILRKTTSGYEWSNESWGWGGWGWGTSYIAGYWINISGRIITNTKPFEAGTWESGQVLTLENGQYRWDDPTLRVITKETNLWTLTPWTYAIGLNEVTWDATPIRLNCRQGWVENVGYFYAWYGATLSVSENFNEWENLWMYYIMLNGWWIHYGYADRYNWTYRKIYIHQNDPVTLTCETNLDVDLNQSLNYTLRLTSDCNLTFWQWSGHVGFTPWCVYQFLIIQDSTWWHNLTLPNNFIFAGWHRTFPTAANSICKLVVDYQDWNYFASITQYN